MNKYKAKINIEGSVFWYLNGLYHRQDGPALVFNNAKCWYLNGERLAEEQCRRALNGQIQDIRK